MAVSVLAAAAAQASSLGIVPSLDLSDERRLPILPSFLISLHLSPFDIKQPTNNSTVSSAEPKPEDKSSSQAQVARAAAPGRSDSNEPELHGLSGTIWRGCKVHFALGDGVAETKTLKLRNYVLFAAGDIATDIGDEEITHVVVVGKEKDKMAERVVAADVRATISARRKVPRVVTTHWVEDCWKERTLLDEERYVPA